MNNMIPDIAKNYRRYLFVFAAMLLVLLTSCPVKSGIKVWAGIPLTAAQSPVKKGNLFVVGNGSEKCADSEIADTRITQILSTHTNDLLPAVLFTATFLLLLRYSTPDKEPSHARYGNPKIPGTIPIFLQYRKLII